MYDQNIQQYLSRNSFKTFDPQVVLFDMDGVLYDSMPNHAIAWVESMAKFGINMTKAEAYKYEGMRGVETIQLKMREQNGQEIGEREAQRMYDEKTVLFGKLPQAPIMDGVLGLMSLVKKSGTRIGIVTGSGQKPLIDRLLSDFHDYVELSHVVTAYDVKHGKPAPDPYLIGLKRTGNLAPWQGVVVENAPLGVRAGAAANIFTIAVNSGPLPNSALSDAGADLVFNDMNELKEAWGNITNATGNM